MCAVFSFDVAGLSPCIVTVSCHQKKKNTVDVVFVNLGFQACDNCRGRSSSLSGIMQIVTSAVRIDVALTLSRRRYLFAPPNSCGTMVVLAQADAQGLCVAGACSLSEPWWLDQFTAQRQGTTAFRRSSSCATSLIVTNRSRDSSVGRASG